LFLARLSETPVASVHRGVARAVGVVDEVVAATCPLSIDIGRLRAGEHLLQRARHRRRGDQMRTA